MLSPLHRSLGPAFIVPGRSIQVPRWPFAINKDNSIAGGLQFYFPGGVLGGSALLSNNGIYSPLSAGGATTQISPDGNIARRVQGDGKYIEFPGADTNPILTGRETQYTVFLWINLFVKIANSDDSGAWSRRRTLSSNGEFSLNTSAWSTTNSKIGFATYNGGWWSASSLSEIPLNRPTLITYKRNGTSWSLFFDGVLDSSGSGYIVPGGDAGTGFFQGIGDYSRLNRGMNAQVWGLGIFHRALSDAEIWKLYDPATRWGLLYELGRTLYFFRSVAATTAKSGTVTLAVTAATTATGEAARSGAETIPAAAIATATGTSVRSGVGTIATTASPAAIGVAERAGVATISAASAISTTGRQGAFATPTINVVAAVLASGSSARLGAAIITATASASASGTAQPAGTATINAAAALTANGLAARTGIAPLNVFATLTATGTGTGAGALDIVNAVALDGIFDPVIPLAGVFDPVIPLAGIIN